MFAPGRIQRWKFLPQVVRQPAFQYRTQNAFHLDQYREKLLLHRQRGAIQ